MVRELNMDTQRQNFWKESIDKEASVRLAWHVQFSKDLSSQSAIQMKSKQPKKNGTFLPKIGTQNSKMITSNLEKQKIKMACSRSDKTQYKGQVTDKSASEPTTLLIEMRPVTPGTKKLLYKGFSALGEGRYAYLQERKKKKPEQKYEFPITNGWEYGWKITEAMKKSLSKPAEFGRTRIVKDSFYRNNGVSPHDGDLLSCFQ